MKQVCVYCGSSPGQRPEYAQAARALGEALVERELALVFGAGKIGMMGVLARTVLEHGGDVTGVIPKALHALDLVNPDNAVIALPGGFGTVEELFEILTWAQLALHAKPVGLLNVAGYFDHLIRFVDHATAEGFLDAAHRDLLLVDETAAGLLAQLMTYRRPKMDKVEWILRAKLEQ